MPHQKNPYEFYQLFGEILALLGSLYLAVVRLGVLRFDPNNHHTNYNEKTWLMKNYLHIIFSFTGLACGTSMIGRISNLLLMLNVLLAFGAYPHHLPTNRSVTRLDSILYFIRNISFALSIIAWNASLQQDSKHLSAMEVVQIAVGSILFVIGCFFKMILHCIFTPHCPRNRIVRIDGIMFEYLSAPDQLFVVIQWFGYYLVAGDYFSMYFFFFKAQIAIGKAIQKHKWLMENDFEHRPERRAIFPFIL